MATSTKQAPRSAPTQSKGPQAQNRRELKGTAKAASAATLEPGLHEGVLGRPFITSNPKKDGNGNPIPGTNYEYVRVPVRADGASFDVSYDCAYVAGRPITPQSQLGQLMIELGQQIDDGIEVDLEAFAKECEGRRVSFETQQKPGKNGRGSFSEIVEGTLHAIDE